MEESMRVEELDSDDDEEADDDDDDRGVLLDALLDAQRFGREELRLIRAGNSSRGRPGSYEFDDDVNGYSNDENGSEFFEGDTDGTRAYSMKYAPRDKEDLRIEKALERIRRAQILGKKRVNLSSQELEALERRRIQMARLHGSPRNKVARNRPAGDVSPRNRDPRLSNASSPKANIERKRVSHEAYSSPSQAAEPTLGYPPTANRRSSVSSQPRSRAASIQSLSMSPQTTPARSQYHQSRSLQVPNGSMASRPSSRGQHSPRPDLQWMSHPVSTSNAIPFPVAQVPYPPYAATPLVSLDPRYVAPGHHTVQDPNDVHYQPVYRHVSNEFYPNHNLADPFTVQRLPRPEAPRRYRTSSGSSSSDGAVRREAVKHSTVTTGHDARAGSSGSAERGGRQRTSRR